MNQSYQGPLCFGQKIALLSLETNKYLKVSTSSSISATGIHPLLSYSGCTSTQSFTILSASSSKEYCGLVAFTAQIVLQPSDSTYLAFTTGKEVVIETEDTPGFQRPEATSKNTITKWTLMDAGKGVGRKGIAFYDYVVLKTPFGDLSAESSGIVNTDGRTKKGSIWRIIKADVPYMPDWTFNRPYLDFNDLVLAKNSAMSEFSGVILKKPVINEERKKLGSFPEAVQEQLLIKDLIYTLISIEGVYIKRKDTCFTFAVEPYEEFPTCDDSLLYMLANILPLCDQHDKLSVFKNLRSAFECGLVNHALCEAINSLLKEYQLKITQIGIEAENAELTLQKLWYYLQPCMRTLACLSKLVDEIEAAKGGALLNILFKSMVSATDTVHHTIFAFLLEAASVPYLEILSKWIYLGEIDDPYEEFLIKEHKELTKETLHKDFNDRFWEDRFEFRESQIPMFLTKLTFKVLVTGKYLNVIRECGKTVRCPYFLELDTKTNPHLLSAIGKKRGFFEAIERAYEWSAKELLDLILGEQQLKNRLISIKRYFFLDHGDFFVHFMDSAQEELEKHHENVSKEKLESLLDLALRTSSANSDSFKEDLSCDLHDYSLAQKLYAFRSIIGRQGKNEEMSILAMAHELRGLDAFVLDYKVRWPLTLIISRKSLIMYQFIFRHLLYCKYVERQLSSAWMLHQSTKNLIFHKLFSTSYCLRQKMLHFVKNYLYYMTVEVLEEKWHRFFEKLQSVKTIDEIMGLHTSFLEECLKECLLVDEELFLIIKKIIDLCLRFSEMIENNMKSLKVDDAFFEQIFMDDSRRSDKKKGWNDPEMAKKMMMRKKFIHKIENFSVEFDEFLNSLLKTIDKNRSRSEIHLINFVIRLDYNEYYIGSRMFDEKT